MDDGREESPGEQTLTFRAITDVPPSDTAPAVPDAPGPTRPSPPPAAEADTGDQDEAPTSVWDVPVRRPPAAPTSVWERPSRPAPAAPPASPERDEDLFTETAAASSDDEDLPDSADAPAESDHAPEDATAALAEEDDSDEDADSAWLWGDDESDAVPSDETPLDDAPSDEAPSDETPSDETPSDDAPSDEAPSDEAPSDEDDAPSDEADVAGDLAGAADADADDGASDVAEDASDEDETASATADDDAGAEDVPGEAEEDLPPETVEALTAALGALRESVAGLRFGLDLPGAEEARQARADLQAQLEDYVLPRVRTRTAPALIVIAGSTGAGKSTLVNSLAEKNVSRTGVRRPTTGVPVLVCHPDDRKWFTEGELLGGLRRIDKPEPGAGMRSVVVVATEKLPQGVALLDTPDIDSVVEEHHEIAHRMLDAADLWIFVTTAARYADAPAWNLLRLAKERGARLAIVLSRVQPRAREVVLKHFVRMLTEYGLGEIDRFVIEESAVTDGRLPDSEMTDLRLWLAELSVDDKRRAQAVRKTLNGVLDSFRTRVPALAKQLELQVAFRSELRGDVEAAYMSALTEIDKAFRSGMIIQGEVLARWQDFAGSGDLMRSLQLRKRPRSSQAPERITAFRGALKAGLESVIVAAAGRAAEEVAGRWRHRAEVGATLAEGLERPSDELVRHAGRAVASWQEHVIELVRTEGVAKRSVSKLVSFDADSLSLIFMVAMFSGGRTEGVPHRLVKALLGAESLRGIGAKALSDLRARIGMLFDEESMRYVQALDSAGIPDESAATHLYQATYNLEVAR
ncbi:dynamin family protein [Nonomuraea sp. ATR24]|uniref:dynamin family protein n=1 Tax=Nonomuraea sp. ATR24 TaxID=1676744 RepID=UPI0035BF14DC